MGPVPSFGNKWKEVLGFGDGNSRSYKSRSITISKPKPSLYQITPDATYTSQHIKTTTSSNKSLSYPRIPRSIVFCHRNKEILISACPPPHASSSHKEFVIPSLSSRPLFLISLSADVLNNSGRPDITLHATADKASTVVCFAKINFSSPVTDMTLCPPPKKSISANFSSDDIATPLPTPSWSTHDGRSKHSKSKSMYNTGSFTTLQSSSSSQTSGESHLSKFRCERLIQSFDPASSSYKYTFFYGSECFEWRRTEQAVHYLNQYRQSRSQVRGYKSDGMKLVRVLTGEVLVIFARISGALSSSSSQSSTSSSPCQESSPNMATSMMCFRNTETLDEFGEDFDIMVVVSLVSIVEKERRERHYPFCTF